MSNSHRISAYRRDIARYGCSRGLGVSRTEYTVRGRGRSLHSEGIRSRRGVGAGAGGR